MKTLYAFGDLYDAYNESVKDKSVMKIPSSFFNAIEGCDTESRLLANIDSRVLKLDWRSAEYGRGLSCFLLSRATLLSPPSSASISLILFSLIYSLPLHRQTPKILLY